MAKIDREAFIVHKSMTGDNKYHASYGPNFNKTQRSFKTLSAAKAYVKQKGYSEALYDGPTATKTIKIGSKTKTKPMKKRKTTSSKSSPNWLGFDFKGPF